MDIVILHQHAPHGGKEYKEYHANGEDHRQQMYKFQRFRVFLVEVDAGNATVVYLSEELAEVRPSLVPNP